MVLVYIGGVRGVLSPPRAGRGGVPGRLLRDPELTVDLTAETFARAYRARAKFDPERGSARGWLLGIARHVRAASRGRGRVETEAREQLRMHALRISTETLSSVEQAVIEDGETVVEDWLSGLPESERDAPARARGISRDRRSPTRRTPDGRPPPPASPSLAPHRRPKRVGSIPGPRCCSSQSRRLVRLSCVTEFCREDVL
jgi:hypothetical protein